MGFGVSWAAADLTEPRTKALVRQRPKTIRIGNVFTLLDRSTGKRRQREIELTAQVAVARADAIIASVFIAYILMGSPYATRGIAASCTTEAIEQELLRVVRDPGTGDLLT